MQVGMDAGCGEPGGWRFVAVGDSRGTVSTGGHNAEILGEIAAACVAEGAEFIAFMGDLVYGSADAGVLEAELLAWRQTMEPAYAAGVRVYPVRGNHDDDSIAAWNAVFDGGYALPANGPEGEENLTFAVQHENALVLGLDAYVNPHRVNLEWVDEQLAAATADHVIAFVHEPAYSAYHTDCLDDCPAERDALWQGLQAAGARVFLAGHDHFYAHARVDDGDGDTGDDMHQVIVGTGGAPPVAFDGDYDGQNGEASVVPIDDDSPYGYLLVRIDGPEAELTWKKRVGKGTYESRETWCYIAGEE
jgi:hypothetical protein